MRLRISLFAAFLLSSVFAGEKWSGDGLLVTRSGSVPILFMSGTPEEMGSQHGALLKDLISVSYSRILLVAGGYLYLKDDWFFDRIKEVERRVNATLPDRYLRECDAMSEAAGLSREDGRAINLFPEMFHCSGIAARGKATTDGKVVHARVLDYMRDIGLQKTSVLQVFQPKGFNAWLSVGFAGLNGTVTCMNEKGLAMGEMGGRGEGKWDGLPMTYLMRRIMEECATVEEALKIIRATPLTCTYYYVLSDASGDMVAIEADAGKPVEVLRPGQPHPRLGKTFEDVVYVTAPKRQPALVARLEEHYGRIDADSMREIVKRPVAMASNLHDAIFLPETRDVLFAVAGKKSVACDEPYEKVNLLDLLSRYRAARASRSK